VKFYCHKYLAASQTDVLESIAISPWLGAVVKDEYEHLLLNMFTKGSGRGSLQANWVLFKYPGQQKDILLCNSHQGTLEVNVFGREIIKFCQKERCHCLAM
jgi:hypothetical protein